MADYASELAADWSDSDGEVIEAENSTTPAIDETAGLGKILEAISSASSAATVASRLLDVSKTANPLELTKIHPLVSTLRGYLSKNSNAFDTDLSELISHASGEAVSPELRLLSQISELPNHINAEIALLHKFASTQYSIVLPELVFLIPSPVTYCKVVLVLGQDLTGVRKHEAELKQLITGEKVLAVTMAALQHFSVLFELSALDFAAVQQACRATIELAEFLGEVSAFITQKLSKLAPNVSNLIGPATTSQLLIAVGSLKQLALTPACNLASFGVKDLSAQTNSKSHFVRSTGYLFYCDLVRNLPPEIIKQALRIVSAKVILAARIDMSGSCPSGELGAKYLEETRAKIDKLLAPPDQVMVKALAVPKEQKLKKRGGRRFRKMKERFQMSELRKAQNKLQFGKQEDTIVDAFGEEVGLGMSRQIDGISVNRNTDAKMSKAMVGRLNKKKETANLDSMLESSDIGEEKQKESGEWGRMKRQRLV